MALTRQSLKWICHCNAARTYAALTSLHGLVHPKTNFSSSIGTFTCFQCARLQLLNMPMLRKQNIDCQFIRMASELHSKLTSCDPATVSCDRILNLVKQFHKTCEATEIILTIQLLELAYPREKDKWIFGINNDSRMKAFIVRINNRLETFLPNELLDVLQGLVALGGSLEDRWMQNLLEKTVEARRFFSELDQERLKQIYSIVIKGHEDSIFVKSLSKQFTIKRFG